MTFRTTEPSRTLQLNELAKDMAAAGETVYRFGFGQSPFMPPRHVQDALHEATGRVDYAPVQGIRELREKIAQFHTATEGIDTSPEQIIVGSGSKILLLNTLMAFEPAHVVLPAPSWVSYKPQAQMAGHELHWIPTTFEQRWRITPAQLDAHMATLDGRSKILVLNYPGNPDGLTYTAPELEALAPVLEKHGVWVLSDEIYGMVHHDGAHVSLRKYYPQRTLVTSGLSKWCAAGGWRMGVQLLPVDIPVAFRDALLAIASSSYSCAPTPVQVAAIPGYIWDEVSQTYIGRQQHI
ncbi:MAG: aminotransferase class I/II-fold pyridoxal phosphate-dependent enzyme, partial [Chloroflexota bacterium]